MLILSSLRLRARLLEFLARVLASQEALNRGNRVMATMPSALKVAGLWPEAIDLADADLLAVLDQARTLYVN